MKIGKENKERKYNKPICLEWTLTFLLSICFLEPCLRRFDVVLLFLMSEGGWLRWTLVALLSTFWRSSPGSSQAASSATGDIRQQQTNHEIARP